MVQLHQSVNVNEIPESQGFDPLPAGDYLCMVTASEMKPTKNSGGEYLELSIEVQEGQYSGRKLFERLNIKNANETAEKIAWSALKQLCQAIGVENISNTDQLHNKRFAARVEVEQGKPYMKDGAEKPGNPQNRIKKYLSANGTSAGPRHSAAQNTSQGVSENTPPWKRG